MARQQLKQYIFSPGGAGAGYVKVPGNYSNAQILAILNATKQAFIYNFSDTTIGATITWVSTPDADFPQSIDGVTTVTFITSTATMSAADKLAIYVEQQYVAQRPFALDAVERLRVANPQSLIDADYEYGLQATKWQSLNTNNDNPAIYELPGTDSFANTISYLGFTGNSITSNAPATVIVSNGTSLGNNQPNWSQSDYALLLNTDPVGKYPTTTFLTANVASLSQRDLTVKSTTGFAVNDTVALVYAPNTSPITTTTASLTAGQTALSISGANAIVNGSMIMVFTANTTAAGGYETELMAVAAGGTSGALTVVRNRMGTNRGNAAIASGSAVSLVGAAELGNITAISGGNITVNRSYMNTVAQDSMPRGTAIMKCHWDPVGTTGTNLEIITMATIGTAAGNIAQTLRASLGTTAVTSAGAGSLLLRLTGIFVAGDANQPVVAINLPGHAFVANSALSTSNHIDTNSEGQYQVNFPTVVNYISYYPRNKSSQFIGYQLNRWDSFIRYAGFYGTANLPPVTLSTDAATPSTITATSLYAHGITPGTPILANIASAGTNGQYATGAFTVLSVPTPTTFTYQARPSVSVTGPIVGVIYVRPSAFYIHRAADGGVNLGTGTPHSGASASRQSKRYFRYQSGKGMMWTSGTLLGSNFDIQSISAAGTGVGNAITITTDQRHQMQVGANIILQGIQTTGYNGYYLIQSIVSEQTFTVNAQSVLGGVSSILFDSTAKVATYRWNGASVRAGMFDDQNGLFWENTGASVNVVQRSSTHQVSGYVSVGVSTNLVTGDQTRFTQDFVVGDKMILRGMTHTVTSVIDDSNMTIAPVWRGLSNQTRIKPSKRVERRVPQSQWNIDSLDGLGASGYLLDATRMQMLMIQYTWYGAGFVDFGVRGPLGNYIFCHRFMNNNLNYEAFMRSGNLPARYQAINEVPYTILRQPMDGSQTTFELRDSIQFPTPTPASPVYVLIENEILKCTGITANALVSGARTATVTGVTRASTFNLYQDGANKSFSAGSAAAHSANVSVRIISATSAPSLNHWGSAVILDGGFDIDRGYSYTYSLGNVAFPLGTSATNTTITAFAIRLAPSVSNQIPGDLGNRDLINRSQMILNNMLVNFSGANISASAGARYLIEGILNPNNVSTTSTTWQFLYNQAYDAKNNPSAAVQPSYTQVAFGNLTGSANYAGQIGFTNYSFAAGGVSYARGGERLFAIPVNATNSGQLDLSMVKQLGNSGIPGYNIYPDGPELLCINITAIVPTPGVAVTGEVQLQWAESQA